MSRVLVTGGCGFIGSAVVRRLIATTGHEVCNLDALTYAGDPRTVASVADDPRYRFAEVDIADAASVAEVFTAFDPDVVVHLAAETHVDRSIDAAEAFIRTNVTGTHVMLEAARTHLAGLDAARGGAFRFVHVSTDEVFGSLGPDDAPFDESTPYDPRSPYSASKAASDHLARAWFETHGLPVVVTNCSNNYGPFQFPEKLIPLMTLRAMAGEPLPVYGTGDNVRDWLQVDDHAAALLLAAFEGEPGRTYCVGGAAERTNLEIVHEICDLLDERLGRIEGGQDRRSLITFVADRPGHDQRYAVATDRIETELGWSRTHTFDAGLAETVDWYLAHRSWWAPLVSDATRRRGRS